MIGTIGFLFPWLLLTLVALPILWIILRAVPPAPIRRVFPGVTLLLGLKDEEQTSDRTPWWLLLLRMIALAALIIGLAGPCSKSTQRRDRARACVDRDGCKLGKRTGLVCAYRLARPRSG